MPTQFKESRKQCYSARDKYWECLDLNNEKEEKCVAARKEFEKFCYNQWVMHFDRKRKYEKYKESVENNTMQDTFIKNKQ